MNIMELKGYITDIFGEENVIENADMSKYSSFKTGGKADLLAIPQNMDQLRYLLYLLGETPNGCNKTCCAKSEKSCKAKDCKSCCGAKSSVPYMIIGNSSNLLVRDRGYRGVLIKLGGEFTHIEVEGQMIHAGGAALLSKVAKTALDARLSGFEFAAGIPGSVGGGVYMNAGAYGGELKQNVYAVQAIAKDGMREYLKYSEELEFGYRHSTFCSTEDIITKVTFKLSRGDKAEIAGKMKELAEKRNAKQPVSLPSAGSFFKRPTGNFAGALIEGAGLKGLSVGAAQVSPLHAGFIVNNGGATASEIISLMTLVQNTVYDKSGIKLEPEVRIIGEE